MAGVVVLIWGGGKTNYFCKQDWTGQISLIRHDNSGFRRAMEPLLTTVSDRALRNELRHCKFTMCCNISMDSPDFVHASIECNP